MRDFEWKPLETADLLDLIEPIAGFLLAVAQSWVLKLRADGTDVEEAIKSLNAYVRFERMCVKRVFTSAAGLYFTPEETTAAWERVEIRSDLEFKTVLYPALEPGRGDERLIQNKTAVTLATAARYLGRSLRQVQRLVESGALEEIEGSGRHYRKVTTASLLKYAGISIQNPTQDE
jgi:hypothetical protein